MREEEDMVDVDNVSLKRPCPGPGPSSSPLLFFASPSFYARGQTLHRTILVYEQ